MKNFIIDFYQCNNHSYPKLAYIMDVSQIRNQYIEFQRQLYSRA